jgi:ribonuclease G
VETRNPDSQSSEGRRRRPKRRGGGGGGGRRREREPRGGGASGAREGGEEDSFREIIVSAQPHQTRVAIMENSQLVEFMVERPDQRRIVGDIYKGKVTAILPGIQAAFLDIGLEKGAFLHVSDLAGNLEDLDIDDDDEEGKASRSRRESMKRVPIEEQISKGDELLVQVMKEPIGTKGPRVTAQITLPGRFVVLMPGVDHVGVSRKIEDRGERARLRQIIQRHRPGGVGLIVRTVGAGEDEIAFESDIRFLTGSWEKIQSESGRVRAPSVVHRDMSLTTGLTRDVFTEQFDRLIVDDPNEHGKIMEYLESVSSDLGQRVELYQDEVPIFDAFDIEPEIEKTLHRKVWMKKGGYICIDQAEALIAIDINTGRYKGKSDQEETIFRCNLEAAREIPRQLRLRDIGGLIVIDFIDMASEENKAAVLEELRRHLKKDRARTKTYPVSELGLVEMTRQRVRPAMASYSTVPCPECEGTGRILSPDSMMAKAERIIRRVGRNTLLPRIEVRVHADRADYLLDEGFDQIAALEGRFDLAVDVREDKELRQDDIRVLDDRGRDVSDRFA